MQSSGKLDVCLLETVCVNAVHQGLKMALYCCTKKGQRGILMLKPLPDNSRGSALCLLGDAFIVTAVTPLSLVILPLKISYLW